MTEIEKTIAFLEEEEDFYLEEGDDERAAHCGRAVIALRKMQEGLLCGQGVSCCGERVKGEI